MTCWIGVSPSGDAGQPSYFQEDFSNILQEHGLNEFVNLLGIADHTQFNTFHSYYNDTEGSCSNHVAAQQNLVRSEVSELRIECAEDCRTDKNAISGTDYLVPSPYAEPETPKQSRGASPDRHDYAIGQHRGATTPKRRWNDQADEAEESKANRCTFHGIPPRNRVFDTPDSALRHIVQI